jgi:hypothetical protein
MRRAMHLFALSLLTAASATAQNWSIGGGTGAFVFGDFVQQTVVLGTENGDVTYIATSSPFRKEDLATPAKGIHILRPKNVHTTVGVRYRF